MGTFGTAALTSMEEQLPGSGAWAPASAPGSVSSRRRASPRSSSGSRTTRRRARPSPPRCSAPRPASCCAPSTAPHHRHGPRHHRGGGDPAGRAGRARRRGPAPRGHPPLHADVAFGAAQVYARAAETRAAWDARLEASSSTRSSAVRSMTACTPGPPPSAGRPSPSPSSRVHPRGRGARGHHRPDAGGRAACARRRAGGVQGRRVIVIVGGDTDPMEAARPIAANAVPGPSSSARRSPRPLRFHPFRPGRRRGLRAAAGWPDAPRPVPATELLPERALDGDDDARGYLVESVYNPMLAAVNALLDTLTTYLEQGSSLEATARLLFVHPTPSGTACAASPS